MKAKNIVGLIIAIVIIALFFMLISQEGSKKPVVVDEPKVEKQEVGKPVLSEEDRVLEDLKKQAGAKIDREVSIYYITHCSSCHGKSGEGTRVAPSINGKSYDYIMAKLDDYKNDRVVNSLMKGLLTNTSNEDLEKLAQEISNFK